MKTVFRLYICLYSWLFSLPNGQCINQPGADSICWLNPFLSGTTYELELLQLEYAESIYPLMERAKDLVAILRSPENRRADIGYPILWEKTLLDAELDRLIEEHQLKKLKLRYRKGVEIIKMLYEKILSMDHHFSSLKAQQELLNISNPHNYPEFEDARKIIQERMQKKFGFKAPSLLLNNPYLSAAFSVIGLVVGASDDKFKKTDLNKVSCVLDFTVRMFNDLNVIYYETGYLKDANLTLKKDCELLFTECARQVGYTIPLENCRNNDDWERLYALLDNLIGKAITATTDPNLLQRTESNLLFAIDRTLLFINRYSDFVNQGNEYYKKFAKITSNYENEKTCIDILPDQFKQLQSDIVQTLDKFNNAYRMPEIQGSKLKDMLYGIDPN
jgi:hypothetical protein